MALQQMLKVNERINKITAARTDFTARGMLEDSCLVQAISNALNDADENPMDVNSSDETSSESSDDEVQIFNSDSTGADDFNTRIGGLSDIGTSIPDNTSQEPANNIGDNAVPSGIIEDNDCRPVKSGPLMNEVRLVARKGELKLLPQVRTNSLIIVSTNTAIPHIICCTWFKDRPTKSPRSHLFPFLSTQPNIGH